MVEPEWASVTVVFPPTQRPFDAVTGVLNVVAAPVGVELNVEPA
jgi:hypothetical protein